LLLNKLELGMHNDLYTSHTFQKILLSCYPPHRLI